MAEWDDEDNSRLPITPNPTGVLDFSTLEYSTRFTIDSNSIGSQSPSYPISYSFGNQKWSYVLSSVLGIIFAPILIILSKVTGKETGIKLWK